MSANKQPQNPQRQAAQPTVTGGDERLVRTTDAEERGNPAAAQDLERFDSNVLSEAELERMLNSSEFENNALPQPPELPGHHLCWLTTSSRYDTLAARQRMGYRPVVREEMPGFDPSFGADLVRGMEGYISCNEMILHKIPSALYQKLMAHYHHTRPAQYEQRQLEGMRAPEGVDRDRIGKPAVTMEDGASFLDLEQQARRDLGRAPAFR